MEDDIADQLVGGGAGRKDDIELNVGADHPRERVGRESISEAVAAADRKAALLGGRGRAEVQEVAVQELMLEGGTPNPHRFPPARRRTRGYAMGESFGRI